MPTYEYRLLSLPEAGTSARRNEQIAGMIQQGWEVLLMSGEHVVNILFRREREAREGGSSANAIAAEEE
jgi:hypothetical protein